jgi:glyoxylase-like metal-dependent hydrolase (beta-lactamase superfamily II)
MNIEVHPRIKRVSIWWDAVQSNIEAYLVKGKLNTLVDTGPPQASADVITAALKAFDLAPADIDLILNTHGHIDHIGGNGTVKAAGRAQVMIHREDAVFLEDRARSFDLFYAPGKENVAQQKVGFLGQIGPDIVVDRYLEDNDVIDLGEGVELRVIHLPGHTPGSVGFYFEKEAILICGDSIPGLNTPGGFLPIIYDLASYEKSVERLSNVPLRAMLFSHPYRGLKLPPSVVRREEEISEYLTDSRSIAARLREAIAKQAAAAVNRPLLDIADTVVDALPVEMGFLKMAQLPMPELSLGTVFFALKQART